MCARTVSLRLKPNSQASRTRWPSSFQDRTEVVRVRLWDHQAQADAYHCGISPAVLRALANVVEGTPQVHPSAVSNSTFHMLVAHVAG